MCGSCFLSDVCHNSLSGAIVEGCVPSEALCVLSIADERGAYCWVCADTSSKCFLLVPALKVGVDTNSQLRRPMQLHSCHTGHLAQALFWWGN